MKKQSYLFQKFQKKYSFFQRSFFDFFYWRSTNTFQNKKNLNFSHTQVEKKFYPFEQEKIVFFQNKSNDLKNLGLAQKKTKIKKTFENFQHSNSVFLRFGGTPTRLSHDMAEGENSFSPRKGEVKNNSFSTFLNQSKNFTFDSKKKIRLQFLKKQRKKDKNSRYIQSKDSNFFQRSAGTHLKISSFELFRPNIPSQQGFANGNIPSFGSLKVGNFFPKKKHFQQYWIFPFLGVFVFFSQNSFLVFYNGSNKKKEKSPHFFISQKRFENESRNQRNFENLQMHNLFLNSKNAIQNKDFLPLDFQVSFPSKDSKKLIQVFQTYEKNEFAEFLQFSTKIFQNSISLSPFYHSVDQNENHVFQKMLNRFSPYRNVDGDFDKAGQNFLFPKDFQQKIETKRNTFQWTWFSVNSELSPFLCKADRGADQMEKFVSLSSAFVKNSNSKQFQFFDFKKRHVLFSPQTNELPQKAEFFFELPPFLEGGKFSKQILLKERKMLSTPIFEFSKNLSFLDEYQRKASFLKQNFFEKDDFLFLNSFFSNTEKNEKTKFLLNPIFQKNLGFDSETFFSFFVANKNGFFEIEKTIFFLKNWGKTQKFWNFKADRGAEQQNFQKENFFRKVEKNPNNFFHKERKEHKNLLHLDAIFFQKFFKKFEKTKHQIQISDFDTSASQNSFPSSSEKSKIFLNIQKQTFDFFLFQHYHLKYKKFCHLQKMLPKNDQKFFFVLKTPQKSFSKESKKTEVGFVLKKKKFFPLFCKTLYFFENPNFQEFSFPKKEVQNSKISQSSLQKAGLGGPVSNLKSFSILKEKNRNFCKNTKPFLFIRPILFDHSSQFVKKTDNFFYDFSSNSGENFFIFPQNFSISETKKNLLSSAKIFEFSRKNENLTFESKTKESKPRKNENPFSFSISNLAFFEKLYKNLFKSFVFHFHSFRKFQESFLFETTLVEKPLLYSCSSNKEENSFFDFKTFSKKETPEVKTSLGVFSLKYKKDLTSSFYNATGNLKTKTQKKNWKKEFSSTFQESPRKYEKVFQTFFSPLKIENTNFSSFASPIQKQIQLSKDQIFLNSFSNFVKKSSKNQNFSFFVFKNQKNLKTNSRTNDNNQLFTFCLVRGAVKNEKVNFFQESFQIRTKNQLSPELLLKRDGFVFLGKVRASKTYFRSRSNQTFLRMEKEKFLQKKRRLKKEKLETRRRKKRKRFFPRPTWLRMNFYKKFLKTRHFQKFAVFSFSPNIQTNTFGGEGAGQEFLKKQKIFFFDKSFVHFLPKEQAKISNFQINSSFSFSPVSNSLSFSQKNKNFSLEQKSSDFQKGNLHSFFLKNQKKTFLNKTYGKNFQKWGFYWKKGFANKFDSNKCFSLLPPYGVVAYGQFRSSGQKTSISKNIEHYKISGDIFREFLRFSWKSSWFQTNFQPYTKKIQQSFQTIQSLEAEKNLSNSSFFNFSNFKDFVFIDFSPLSGQNPKKSFLLEKSVVKKFAWYSNIRNSMNLNPVQKSSPNFSIFWNKKEQPQNTKIQNIPEYNRILYARISEVLRNFKFSENTSNDFFFKQLQVQRRKNEKIFSTSKNSFFTKFALFFEKFQVPSQPILPAFSVFSSLLNDSSIKPTGDIPTLRALWAFQKTNLFQFQETNAFRNLWTFKKKTDTFKSLKGTKKIMTFFRKYNGFETLPTNSKYMKNIHFGANQNEEQQYFPMHPDLQSVSGLLRPYSGWGGKTNESNFEKTSFLLNKKGEFFDQINQFDTRTFKKFQNAEKKVSLFGIQSFKQKSKISLRYFKFHLSKLSQKNFVTQKNKTQKEIFLQKNAGQRNAFKSSPPWLTPTEKSLARSAGRKNTNQQNAAKSSLNFWWAQKPQREFDFLGTSFFQPFTFSFEKNQVEKNPFFSEYFFNSSRSEQTKIWSNFTFLFIGALFFQFALFSSFLKIPEIRSVFKFQFLIFSKLWKSFFLIFSSLYNLLQKYTKNAFQIFQNSTYSLGEKKSFSFAEFDQRNFGENTFFSRKNCISEIYFETYGFFAKNQMYFGTEPLSQTLCKKEVGQLHGKKNFDSFFKKIVFEFFPRFSNFSSKTGLFSTARGDKNSSMVFFENKKFLGWRNQIFSKTETFKNLKTSVFMKTVQNFSVSPHPINLILPQPKDLKSLSVFSSLKSLKNQKIYMGDTQNLSMTEKNISFFTFSFLLFGKSLLFVPYRMFRIASNFSAKVFEIVENFFFAVYKFLEKPAEFMIEFIAFVFLIEWSSDIVSFLPDSVESSVWKSSQKLLRPVRIGTFAFHFGVFSPQNIFYSGPFSILSSAGIFTSANFVAFLLQKRLLYVFENSPSLLFQPDIDILVRQRKGMLFWDIWAEILLKAAEKYNVNIPSFVTLKEEQEIFVEKLVRDSQFFQTFQSESFGSVVEKNDSKNSSQSFSNFLQHFVIQNSPSQFFDSSFVSTQNSFQSFRSPSAKNFSLQKKLQQFVISNLFGVKSFENFSNIQNCPASKRKLSFPFEMKKGENVLQNGERNSYCGEVFSGPLRGIEQKNFHNLFPFFENIFSSSVSKGKNNFGNFDSFSTFKNMNRWEANQYATFQSQETDFFFDIHLPKSLRHVHFLKYYEPAHFLLGSLICGVYAGVFPKQVSKNILVVGESGTAKTLFLQALAGETEMKIITENASRYAIVQRGVAVGMKFLRDVFDAIALQTPCFFVMEDLHIIGSKRPFLISENETGKGNLSSFGLEQQEVHETNQMIYQSSRHSIADFRRPYKGDFSMGIPTNFFLQTFYSSFLTSQRTGQKNSFGSFSGEIEKNSFFYSFGNAPQSGSPILSGGANQKGRVFQNSQFFGENFSSKIQNFLSSPFPIDSLDVLSSGIEQNQETQDRKNFFSGAPKIQSCLQLSKEQIFAPPATSPFTVLMMKEQKKLKPKKRVQETSWGGLSVDQILSYQKESSSVRAKVAVLAEKTLNLSRGKFDMITDFLVIIDSVRSNRGFVVFGTTHKPSLLDPALRRPGRFDETLSLSIHPNFLNRFEIFKMNFQYGVSTFDFLDSSLLTENFSEMDLFNSISQTKLSFFHNYNYSIQISPPSKKWGRSKFENFGKLQKNSPRNLSKKERLFSKISPINAFYTNFKSSFFEDFYTQKEFFYLKSADGQKYNEKMQSTHDSQFPLQSARKNKSIEQHQGFRGQEQNSLFRNSNLLRYLILPKGPSDALSLAYSKIGIFLAESNLSQNPTSFIPLRLDVSKNSCQALNFQQFFGNIFYDSRKEQNLQMGVFLSGKISEFLVEQNISISQSSSAGTILPRLIPIRLRAVGEIGSDETSKSNPKFNVSPNTTNIPSEGKFKMGGYPLPNMFEKPSDLFVTKFVFFDFSFSPNLDSLGESKAKDQKGFNFTRGADTKWTLENDLQKFVFTKINSSSFSDFQDQKNFFVPGSSQDMLKKNFSWTAFGNDETWRFATPFLFSLVRKRFLFTKNLFLSKMLFFENSNQRRQPPSPPGSSILMPAKKYENFKRTENDFFQKGRFSMNEKIQMHQKQRFLKQLYNIPTQQYFRSEFRKNHQTLFSASFQELAYLDSVAQTSSSSFFFQKKYVQTRHRFSHINQWWTGMFPEHTRESTFLSDVDWRTMFVSEKEKNTFEFLMDFPDSEQYYNPRNRRWFFKVNSTKDLFTNATIWSMFEKDLQYEIFSHFLMESFHKSFSYFDKQREMLDFFVYSLLQKGVLKEFDFLTTFSRF